MQQDQLIKYTSALIHALFALEKNVKVFHWQTNSFAQHKATDGFLLKYLPLTDQLIEVYLGVYPEAKPYLSSGLKHMPIEIKETNESIIVKMSKELGRHLNDMEKNGIRESSILTIRDSIVSEIEQMIYLFSFH